MQTLNPQHIPGRVTSITGHGGLPAIQIETPCSLAEIYPHGAHLTRFQKTGETPLLFMSGASEFLPDKPIRGGVPVIFPWFGPREGLAAHGFARVTPWNLLDTHLLPDGSIQLHFRLPPDDACQVDYLVTVGASLTLNLTVSNTSNADFTFENCLHTYFHVADVRQIEITGLLGSRYSDLLSATDHTESAESIRIAGEVDRTYQDTDATVEIRDPVERRIIRIRKSGSRSTVVWNPWIAKSQRMPDFGDGDYLQMVCVESGNIAENAISLAPCESSSLEVEINSTPLDV